MMKVCVRLFMVWVTTCVIMIPFTFVTAGASQDTMDQKAAAIAEACRADIVRMFNEWVDSGTLTKAQLFDTFYIPVPQTNPQKYHTQYDTLTDKKVQPILDKYLSDGILFVIAVDRNGYVPTHNKKYSQEAIGITAMDLAWDRTKRMFNDRTGIAAARNKEPFLLQRYQRDTGEEMYDYSVPIIVKGQHWGAVRVGYQKVKK